MQPLIDADVLRYEVGFCGEFKNDDGEDELRSFEFVADILDQRIQDICSAVGATDTPILYLTGDYNFRNDIAKAKPYKGNRKSAKPFHYHNLTHYIRANYNVVEVEGIEADDAIVIEQTKRLKEGDTIICTRDKDLRMCPGMHYGWECGAQPSFGPLKVDVLGTLDPVIKKVELKDGSISERVDKVVGTGLKFFYSQMITGDAVDNIPGLKGAGPKLAWDLLEGCDVEEEMCEAVVRAYREKLGDGWKEYFMEQAHLLWMVNELDEQGNPVMWEMPYDYS